MMQRWKIPSDKENTFQNAVSVPFTHELTTYVYV